MKFLKKLVAVASLAFVGITAAHATQIVGSNTPVTQLNTYNGVNQWSFSDASLQLYDAAASAYYGYPIFDGGAGSTARGTSFIDVFYIDVPDNEYVSFSFGNARGVQASVDFTSLEIGYAYGTGSGDVFYATYGSVPSVTTDTFFLGSGTYEFDISGVYTLSGGGFEGDVFGAPVPEPTNVALMLAGLGALGALARRRKSQA